MTARNMERMEFQPWGRLGGGVGKHGEAIFNEGLPDERNLGRIDELLLQPGDTVTFLSQGGGGYGDPYEREPAFVLNDMQKGLLSEDQAREQYGVVLNSNGKTIDEASTKLLRNGRSKNREAFSFGEARTAFETVWTDKMQLAVNAALSSYPLALRDYLKRQTMAEAESRVAAGHPVSASAVPEIMEELRRGIGLR